jgi:hypothetical protein
MWGKPRMKVRKLRKKKRKMIKSKEQSVYAGCSFGMLEK